jgi:hypothetical protein
MFVSTETGVRAALAAIASFGCYRSSPTPVTKHCEPDACVGVLDGDV